MTANKTHKEGRLQSYRVTLPAGAVVPTGLPSELENLTPTAPDEPPAAVSGEYPLLSRRLCNLGLKFQVAYSQRVSARIVDRSVRTLREWSRLGKIACYFCNGIASTPSPYYTAHSLEICLSACKRGKA